MPAQTTPEAPAGLIADIGGTNVRFALVDATGAWSAERRYRCADFPGPVEAVQTYLADCGLSRAPRLGAFCVACPVLGDEVVLTNSPWRFSIAATEEALGMVDLHVVNDFVANALACPYLTAEDLEAVGDGMPATGLPATGRAPIAALGPGTGLGVALLIPGGHKRWIPVATEGGHVTLPALDDREAAVIADVARAYGHVSAERLVSGPGLFLLYATLCRLDGVTPAPLTPAEVSRRALDGTDAHCREALDMLCAMLGTIAGNLALTIGARGGVYIMGGIVPAMLEVFLASRFRARFEAKGRFQEYLAHVPTWVVTHSYPAFLGLSRLLGRG